MEFFSSRLFFLFFFATLAAFIIVSQSDCSDDLHSKKNTALFVFGDSFFDPGNNNYINTTYDFRADFLPYGETFFKYGTGRFSDGRLIPDFIAEFANLPLPPPFLEDRQKNKWPYGVNFASGGGGALVETHAGLAIDLKTQLGYFGKVEKELISKHGKEEANHLLTNSVYLFSVGGNDLIDPSSHFSSYSLEDYIAIVIGNITKVIEGLHKKGARKFGFVSVVPLGCLPFTRAQSKVNGQCVEELTSSTKLYNAALAKRLEELEKQLKGFRYSNFDSFTVVMDIINNPSKYGFKDVKNACCGSGTFRGTYTCGGMRGGIKEFELCKDPEEHFFFDSYHPCERGHRMLAELMWHGGANITRSFNLKSLFQMTSYQSEAIQASTITASADQD